MLRNIKPTWLRAAVTTGLQTLGGAVLAVVLGVLLDVQQWISDPTNPVDLSAAGAAIAGAFVAFCTALVTAVTRRINPPENSYPEPPTEPNLMP